MTLGDWRTFRKGEGWVEGKGMRIKNKGGKYGKGEG